jgi:adenosine 3'-phospho 5'-phosphosulfate transporter B3
MAWRSESSSSFTEDINDNDPTAPLVDSSRDGDASTPSSSGHRRGHAIPPISGAIPAFTGSINASFVTEDNLRHRHAQGGSFSPSPPNRYNLMSASLDDADMAAGAGGLSMSLSEPRSRAFSQPLTPRSRPTGSSEVLVRPNSDNVRHRKRLGRGEINNSSLVFDRIGYNNSEALPAPPPLLQMDRGMSRGLSHGVAGSEHDFLSLSHHRTSVDDSESSSEDLSALLPKRVTSYPPFGLPTIDGSPIHQRRALTIDDMDVNMKESVEGSAKFVVFGWDMTNYTRRSQFLISAGGTFTFSLMYGYLQELISVELCHRKLGLFLAAAQFLVYAVLSYFFRNLDKPKGKKQIFQRRNSNENATTVPLELYVGLSILRAIDLGMTNLAMQYVNYPAKTLMKSTRIVFTMLFGVLVTKKRYGLADYGIVGLMVAGLGIFMHADAKTSAVFQPLGVIMLTISLLCDGAISNVSESIMNRYEVGQDEFIFRLYSVALFFVSIAAAVKGDLRSGISYLTQAGTLKEIEEDLDPTWSISAKLFTLILFSTTGYLSSSCSAAITKSFGALTMSITSTARKAATIFLSFALFPNECTFEHIAGIVLFIGSLVGKSMRASRHRGHRHRPQQSRGSRNEGHHGDIASSTNINRTAAGIMRRKHVEDAV